MKTPNPLAQQLGIREVINGRSFSTKCGGSILDNAVIAAMQEAAIIARRAKWSFARPPP